jgi:hypothetical protein
MALFTPCADSIDPSVVFENIPEPDWQNWSFTDYGCLIFLVFSLPLGSGYLEDNSLLNSYFISRSIIQPITQILLHSDFLPASVLPSNFRDF